MRKRFFALILASALVSSCSLFRVEEDPYSENPWLRGAGAFLVNEGNFMGGNGSLSFFASDSSKIYNNLFETANGRPLGDVPNSVAIGGDKIMIVVNNSEKIEVVDKFDMKSAGTVTGLESPRNILPVNDRKAYVTSLFSKDIAVIDLVSYTVTGKIRVNRTTESIILAGGKAYASCWLSGNKVMVIDTGTDRVTDSVTVGQEPESMVLDKNNRLWILCTGGYSGNYYPELTVLDAATGKMVKRITFPSKTLYPSCLAINGTRDTLYYLAGSIYKMAITDQSAPAVPFIESNGRLFYKMGVQPETGYIFVTDAVDFQQKGYLLRFSNGGKIIDSSGADIIPGAICFKER